MIQQDIFALKSEKNKDIYFSSFLVVLTILIALKFAPLGVDWHHHGVMFNGAISFFSDTGKLYKDFYYHYGPLTALMHAVVMLIFGKKLIVLQYFTSVIYGVIAFQLYFLSKFFFNSLKSFLIVIITILMAPYFIWVLMPWSSVYAIPFFIMIFRCLLDKNRQYSYITLGVSVAMIFFIRQSNGLLCVAALSLLIFIGQNKDYYKKSMLVFFIMFLFGTLILVLNGVYLDYVLKAFKGQVIFTAGVVYSKDGTVISFLKSILVPFFCGRILISGFGFFNLVFIFFLIYIFFNLFKYKFSFFKHDYFDLILFCLASLGQMAPVDCDRHYYWAFLPTAPLLIFFLNSLLQDLNGNAIVRIFTRLAFVFLLVILMFEISFRLKFGLERIHTERVLINSEDSEVLSGMRISKDDSLFFFPYMRNFKYKNSYKKMEGVTLLPYANINNFRKIQSDSIFKMEFEQMKREELDSFPYYLGWKHPLKTAGRNDFLYCSKEEFLVD